MNKKILNIVAILIIVININGCNIKELDEPISKTELFMGTVIKVTLYDTDEKAILDKAFDQINEIENLVSINKDNTEIDELNKNAGIKKVKLSEMSYEMIKTGLEYSKFSDGNYDITIGPLVKLWSIGLPEARVPLEEEINKTIKLVDYSKVKMDDSTKEVYLENKGMMIDLGSIAKGYAADKVVEVLKDEGVKRAIIDLGGNIYAIGSKKNESGWKIGIQDPLQERGNAVGTIEIVDKTVVTSGIYERYIEKDGIKYHHILNPKTGYPFESNIAGVSIIADKSIDADALSTLIFTKDVDEGIKIINGLKNIDAIFITKDKEIFLTNNVKNKFKLINDSYKIVN